MRALLESFQLACSTFITVVLLSGCVWGVNKVEITRGPLNPNHDKKEGIVGVRTFIDARKGNLRKIGTVYSAAGAVGSVELKGNTGLGDIFTAYMVETLENAGYKTVIVDPASTGPNSSSSDKVPVILDGLITEFWENSMVKAWSRVEVNLLLSDAINGDVLWTKTIYGYGESTLWIGVQSEFEDSIRQAIDEALRQASAAFVSDAFSEKVNKTNAPPAQNTTQ